MTENNLSSFLRVMDANTIPEDNNGAEIGAEIRCLRKARGLTLEDLAAKIGRSIAVSYTHLTLPTTPYV